MLGMVTEDDDGEGARTGAEKRPHAEVPVNGLK